MWCVVTLRRGECFGCGGSRWGGSRGWSSESGRIVAGWLCRRPLLAGVVGVTHSRTLCVGGNRGIMRNSTVSSGRSRAPMCIDPPHCTWEPDHHIRRSPEKPDIPTKNNPCPAEIPVSHVQHPRHPHPKHIPTTPRTEIGPLPARDLPGSARRRSTHDKLKSESHMPHLKTISKQQTRGSTTDLDTELDRSRRGTGPISVRVSTDFGAEADRSRRGTGPISARNWTDLEPEYDRSRAGVRPISARRGRDVRGSRGGVD